MPSYPVRCYTCGCEELAIFKIAARWSDGVTQELKTYALTCSACLAEAFRRSLAKQAACRLAPGETLESLGIYELVRGRRDPHLIRRDDLEKQLTPA
jgi:DNA-directed RNA polymerase subunit N (RpoN/RPB10)